MIELRPRKGFIFPIFAECVNPDVFDRRTPQEVGELSIWEGNKQRKLSDLFKVEETEGENKSEAISITINGDASKVRKIGSHMKNGEITINGDAGMHLGEEMNGGTITVHGNVGSWAGSMMKKGTIEIYGNAGDYLGAPYRGSTVGVNGGRIIVHGNVGNEAGARMKKGTIKVYGNAGQFTGLRLHEGTIYVQGDCDERAGACMVEGKIIIGGQLPSVLPTFTIDNLRLKVKVEETESVEGPFYVFLGDRAERGNGKLYVSKQKNPHLSHYEKLL